VPAENALLARESEADTSSRGASSAVEENSESSPLERLLDAADIAAVPSGVMVGGKDESTIVRELARRAGVSGAVFAAADATLRAESRTSCELTNRA
jgi:hypothetical protein